MSVGRIDRKQSDRGGGAPVAIGAAAQHNGEMAAQEACGLEMGQDLTYDVRKNECKALGGWERGRGGKEQAWVGGEEQWRPRRRRVERSRHMARTRGEHIGSAAACRRVLGGGLSPCALSRNLVLQLRAEPCLSAADKAPSSS